MVPLFYNGGALIKMTAIIYTWIALQDSVQKTSKEYRTKTNWTMCIFKWWTQTRLNMWTVQGWKISDQFRFPQEICEGMQAWRGVGVMFWWHVMYETCYCGAASVHIHVLIIMHNNFAWVTRIIKTANKSALFSTLPVVLRLSVTQMLTLSSSCIWRSEPGVLARCKQLHTRTAIHWLCLFNV